MYITTKLNQDGRMTFIEQKWQRFRLTLKTLHIFKHIRSFFLQFSDSFIRRKLTYFIFFV